MTLIEIENLSAADLKAKKAELVEVAKAADVGELAARYVQARTDATCRDEKLAEQGTTITALHESLAAHKAKIDKMAAEAEDAGRVASENEARLAQAIDNSQKSLAETHATLVKTADRLKQVETERDAALALAKARRAVLADVMTKVGPLLAAE